jgi:hypothetical protein
LPETSTKSVAFSYDCECLLYDKGRDHGGYGFYCLNGDFVLVMVVVVFLLYFLLL